MVPYNSKSGKDSGVTAYEIKDEYIIVQFNSIRYRYSYKSCGAEAVETMKELARASKGLSTFIARRQPAYDEKD